MSHVSCPSSFTGWKKHKVRVTLGRPASFRQLWLNQRSRLPRLSLSHHREELQRPLLFCHVGLSRTDLQQGRGWAHGASRTAWHAAVNPLANLSDCWTYKAGVMKHLLQAKHSGIYSMTAHQVQDLAPDNLIQAAQYHANAVKSIM